MIYLLEITFTSNVSILMNIFNAGLLPVAILEWSIATSTTASC